MMKRTTFSVIALAASLSLMTAPATANMSLGGSSMTASEGVQKSKNHRSENSIVKFIRGHFETALNISSGDVRYSAGSTTEKSNSECSQEENSSTSESTTDDTEVAQAAQISSPNPIFFAF